jgi:hypothetical protein
MLIRCVVQQDSIIARPQCSKEFCNTFGGKADIKRTEHLRVFRKFVCSYYLANIEITRRESVLQYHFLRHLPQALRIAADGTLEVNPKEDDTLIRSRLGPAG